jgi:hypothetical protein
MPGEPFVADPDPTPSGPESDSSPVPPQPPAGPPPEPPPAFTPLGLDRQGLLEAAAGTVIALIALFSSYDHITLTSRTFPLQQQWGVWLIAASLALVFVDAQLATRSRLRAAHERTQERNRADQERDRADQERKRAAERAERQRQGIARLHRCALLGGRVQLDPSPANTRRYRAFLALMADQIEGF